MFHPLVFPDGIMVGGLTGSFPFFFFFFFFFLRVATTSNTEQNTTYTFLMTTWKQIGMVPSRLPVYVYRLRVEPL